MRGFALAHRRCWKGYEKGPEPLARPAPGVGVRVREGYTGEKETEEGIV